VLSHQAGCDNPPPLSYTLVRLCRTIKLWREGRDKPAGEMTGHGGPVLCLAVTEGGELLSGSGDTTIKRWRGTQCVATYKGHTDTVRSVVRVKGECIGFKGLRSGCRNKKS
jgi:WD40 repeat protein